MSYLLIWGAGGHGKVVLDIAAASYDRVFFVDDSSSAPTNVLGRAVYPNLESAYEANGFPAGFVVAIGNNHARARCFRLGLKAGMPPVVLAHRTAVISQYAVLSPGTVVMPFVVVNAAATVGANCILNTSVVVEHDCRVGDHVHLSPGAIAGGGSIIGDLAHVGIGGILLPNSRVGREAVVGAGGVVLRAVDEQLTVVGVPARPIHSKLQ